MSAAKNSSAHKDSAISNTAPRVSGEGSSKDSRSRYAKNQSGSSRDAIAQAIFATMGKTFMLATAVVVAHAFIFGANRECIQLTTTPASATSAPPPNEAQSASERKKSSMAIPSQVDRLVGASDSIGEGKAARVAV